MLFPFYACVSGVSQACAVVNFVIGVVGDERLMAGLAK
jgi:hypothetical protein